MPNRDNHGARSLHCRGYNTDEIGEKQLRSVFEAFGPVLDVYLPKDYFTGKVRGFAYIQFEREKDAETARAKLDRTPIFNDGLPVSIMWAAGDRKTPSDMRRLDVERDNPHARREWGGREFERERERLRLNRPNGPPPMSRRRRDRYKEFDREPDYRDNPSRPWHRDRIRSDRPRPWDRSPERPYDRHPRSPPRHYDFHRERRFHRSRSRSPRRPDRHMDRPPRSRSPSRSLSRSPSRTLRGDRKRPRSRAPSNSRSRSPSPRRDNYRRRRINSSRSTISPNSSRSPRRRSPPPRRSSPPQHRSRSRSRSPQRRRPNDAYPSLSSPPKGHLPAPRSRSHSPPVPQPPSILAPFQSGERQPSASFQPASGGTPPPATDSPADSAAASTGVRLRSVAPKLRSTPLEPFETPASAYDSR